MLNLRHLPTFTIGDQLMTRITHLEPLIEGNEREYYDSGIPSSVAILGHPLHPLIVTFPVAFLTTALLTDILFLLTNSSFWATASFWLIVGGILTGILAGLTGMLDFFKIHRVREHKAGWIHMVGNITALVLSGISLFLRWDNVIDSIAPWGIILSLVVAGLLGITGWYGGELVYRHKIAVIGDGNPHQA
ncbi:DUF2231 domain-containing protein [Planktothrix sp. FACHB-1365]|uniref:DUF2231 domain-containing protein n=1 Tax=Planktothrix sp. FACHB-1365 TaxID=2692855 RepID=UPI002814A404|nr:DUF2231 domain-containing protein [Planktothrix sp. FACHB-1365]